MEQVIFLPVKETRGQCYKMTPEKLSAIQSELNEGLSWRIFVLIRSMLTQIFFENFYGGRMQMNKLFWKMIKSIIFKEMLDVYLNFRKVSGLKRSTTFSLVQFYRDCNKKYPENKYLTQEMIDWWCAKRNTDRIKNTESSPYQT